MKMAIYKESTEESTIDLVFAISLLLDSLIYCKIVKDFDCDLEYQLIFSKYTSKMIDRPPGPRCLLVKMDAVLLIKTWQQNLVSISCLLLKTPEELDKKVISQVKIIDIAMDASIFKAKLYPKLIPRFDENCKIA